jgi:hypothetical protein
VNTAPDAIQINSMPKYLPWQLLTFNDETTCASANLIFAQLGLISIQHFVVRGGIHNTLFSL